jgi:hypothetical protein
VTAWFEVTDPAVSTPPAPIDAYDEFSLHEGVTGDVVLSLQVAVAAYVALPFSFTDDGPAIDSEETVGTFHAKAVARADFSPVLSTASAVT